MGAKVEALCLHIHADASVSFQQHRNAHLPIPPAAPVPTPKPPVLPRPPTRGLHSFQIQLNLSSSVHRVAQLSS